MVGSSCDPNDRHTARPDLLIQSRPQLSDGPILSPEPHATGLEREALVLRAAMLRRCDKLLELAKHGPLYGGIVGVGASLTEGLDQAREERLALLAVEPWGTQRIASGTHTGSDSEAVVDARLHRVLP